MNKTYRHTFYLLSGEILVGYSESKDIPHLTFGNETAFFTECDNIEYTIPFFSVGYIETELICDEA
jgi:hypothetical protein